jgi:hypothetical protein
MWWVFPSCSEVYVDAYEQLTIGIDRQSHKQRKLPPHAQPTRHMDREGRSRTFGIRLLRQLLGGFGRACTQSTICRLFASCLRKKKREFYNGGSSFDDTSTGFQVASSKIGTLCLHCKDEHATRAEALLSSLFLQGQWVLADTKSAQSDDQSIFEVVRDITRSTM